MSGTLEGGRKAAITNKLRHGDDFYAHIGSKGGQMGTTGGFAADRERAREAGRKGGSRSRRGAAGESKVKPKEYIWRPGDELFSK